MSKRVVIGLSGGVDSAVSAYLLKKSGYEVVGVTFKTLEQFDSSKAINVANELGIEFHEVDIVDKFNEKVINTFINDYQNGLTPNPCVICNREIKFNFLYQAMLDFNCDYLATGHYAKIIDNHIYKSDDLNKDQSYFLGLINKEIVPHIIFPLEGIDKEEVRKIANEIGLSNANQKDSYDVCFINDRFRDFMEDKIGVTKGNVVLIDEDKVIGKHNGLSLYTVGQRRGLDIGGYPEPLFVCGKDIKTNTLYVTIGSESKYLYSNNCIIKNVNLFTNDNITKCLARTRYRAKDMDVTLEYLSDNRIRVKYDSCKSVTPGQTCALYLNNELIGAGIIDEIYDNDTKLWYL